MRKQLVLALLVSVVSVGGCKGTRMSGKLVDRVVTSVAPVEVRAGESAAVTCTLFNDKDVEIIGETRFDVSPADGREVAGQMITPTLTGEYTVVCASPEFELVDPVGAVLTVLPGAPARVTAIADKPQLAVFEKTNVTCAVEDAYGNAIDVETSVQADEGVSIADHQVSAAEIGTYEVSCLVVGGGDGVESVPASLDVTADDPVSIELVATPMRTNYGVGATVTFSWIVLDQYGNDIPDLPGVITAPGTGISTVDVDARKYRFTAEGIYTFSVRLDAPWDALTDDLTLTCDETGPEIVITWPPRGETVLGGGEFLEIEGTVKDAFGEVGLFEINGITVPVGEDGAFTATVLPEWGVNVINAFARDEFNIPTKLTPTFAYSSDYLSFVEEDVQGVKQEDGLALLVGQDFLDDGDHDPTNVNDLATMLEQLLGGLDITQLVGGFGNFDLLSQPLFEQQFNLGPLDIVLNGALNVTVNIIDPTDIGPTMVTIDSRVGGIDTAIELGDAAQEAFILTLQLEAKIPVNLEISVFGFDVDTSITGAATLFTQVSLDSLLLALKINMQKATGGELQVELTQFDTDLTGLEIDPIQDVVLSFALELPQFLADPPFNLGPFTFDFALSQLIDLTTLTDAILDPITSQFLPFVIDLLQPTIQTFVDDILKNLLLALQLETSFELPELLGPKPEAIFLDIYTDLSSVQFTDDGGQIGLGLGLYADKGIDRDPLGAIQRDGCLKGQTASFTYGWERSVGGAIKTDVINSALFSIWWSGFLNGPLDLGGLLGGGGGLPIPVDDIALDMEFLLPPIISDCSDKGVVTAEIGDLHAFISGDLLGLPFDGEIYADVSIPLFFAAGPDGLSVTVGDFEFLDVEVIQISEDPLGLFDLRDLLENQLGSILGGFVAGQSFGPIAIPEIDLGSLVPGLPSALIIKLGNLSVDKEQGYVVIAGDLE